jgi:fucose 4-O-acetylase-like acetyltransferase
VPWIDVAKAFGITIVVLEHNGLLSDCCIQGIRVIDMPLFMFVSGFLFSPQATFKQHIAKAAKRLLIPYIVYSLLNLVLSSVLAYVSNVLTLTAFAGYLGSIFLGIGHSTTSLQPVWPPGWFLVALFFLHIVAYFIKDKRTILWSLFVAFLLCLLLRQVNFIVVLPVLSALMAYPFYSIGRLLKMNTHYLEKRQPIWLLALLLIVVVLMSHFNGNQKMVTFDFGRSVFVYYICSGMALFLVIQLCMKVAPPVFVRNISQGTLLILGLHWNMERYILVLLTKMIPDFEINNVIGLAIGLIIILASYPLILFSKKYCPIFLGK